MVNITIQKSFLKVITSGSLLKTPSIRRQIYTFNDKPPIRRMPPPPINQYKRFQQAQPFYQKKVFWVYTGVIGGLAGTYYLNHLETVPITGRRRFIDITPKQEELMSQQSYSQIMSIYRNKILPSRHPDTQFVRRVAERIIKVSGMEHLHWEFYVIASPEKNAFVLPGGKIFVFTGILPVTKNEDGMAAVLGHEIGHQIARHSAEKLSFVKILFFTQVLLSLIVDPGLLSRVFFELGIMMPFSRKCETEADYIGLLLMAQACFDPTEAKNVWIRMNQVQKIAPPQFLSTHPANKTRIQKIEEWMPEAMQKRASSDCEQSMAGFRDAFDRMREKMVRLAVYGAVSTFLAFLVVAAAFRQRSNFYAACIYLSKSSACMMILMNMGFFLMIIFGQILQHMFFGRLRALEIEHLYERAWYAVTETCLAMTIFRDEFDTRFFVTFTTLLFLKTFHWLCQDRVEYVSNMEQLRVVRFSFHLRMVALMEILCAVDFILVFYAVDVTMKKGPNMMIMFAFEYAILAATIISTFCKYILNIIELRREEPWQNKSLYVFYLELVTDFFKLITYLIFFAIILISYGLPLHIIRDVYVTLRSFLQKCGDLIRYRRATRNMNERYPNATVEELERLSDRTCIICREEMVAVVDGAANAAEAPQGDVAVRAAQRRTPQQPANNGSGDTPKKLPCGHIFHFHCLRSWLERQQSCPTCRRPVLEAPPTQQPPQQAARYFANPMPGFMVFPPPAMQIPGLIPLFHTWPGRYSAGPPNLGNGSSSSSTLDHLSEEQIRVLETETREALSERIRVLHNVDEQIYNIISVLTQTLSVLPPITSDLQRGNQTQPDLATSKNTVTTDSTTSNSSNNINGNSPNAAISSFYINIIAESIIEGKAKVKK
ncbi:11462_t:CDS:10 [Ambispora leptoticha]|uniref:RING-type E3 ubiquitin transferase n=1 Tax=Ambispora leptoticha TaxID=144679 RepID=A0A9N9D5H1_9GLOM|nr:11462_t:CDS:10 [Ambispora leptoticha]